MTRSLAALARPEDAVLDIRPAARTDLAALARLEARVFVSDRLSRRSFARFLAAGDNPLLVAVSDGRIAAYGLILLRTGSPKGRLYSIAVDPDFAGRGIGRRLLSACEAAARRRGIGEMRLEVRTDNFRALALYADAGYRIFGLRRAYYADGCDALRLRKPV